MGKQGRRKTPIMGWASWNCFRTNINEEKMKEQADLLVSTGLSEYGYEYFNMDDGFFGGRSESGELLFHEERFPNGIKVIADYAHALGLKAGIYAEAGDNTCGYYYDNETIGGLHAGLYGQEETDLRKLLCEGGFDFIKVDWCGGLRMGLDEEEQYTKIANIIRMIEQEENRQIIYNICRWQFPGEALTNVADSWRCGADITPDFQSVLYQIDELKALARFCRPGHVNDCDMMQLGNGMTYEEDMTHFAMWCMLSTPLMLGCDLKDIKQETLDILKNRELIAINQDPLCKQAVVVKEYKDADEALLAEVWVKPLEGIGNKRVAIAFLNRSEKEMTLEVDYRLAGIAGGVRKIRDVVRHQDVEILPAEKLKVPVVSHGVTVYEVEFADGTEITDINEYKEWSKNLPEKISMERMEELVNEGALLIDVRNSEEYETFHLDNAINISYQDMWLETEEMLPERTRKVVLYCATGKRSLLAKLLLDRKGYEHVYYLGGIK